ncbi:hypothetical protein ACVBEH_13920 [Roseateles sp. GG27B]
MAEMAGWTLNGSGESLRDILAPLQASPPDIIACDLRLLDGHACRLARQFQQWSKRPQMLLLTATADDLLLFQTLRCGASSYCIETGDGQGLAQGLQRLAAGRSVMSPRIARHTLEALELPRSCLLRAQQAEAAHEGPAPDQPFNPVIPAEQHLLSLLAHGLLSEEIGRHWGLAQAEIERRLYRIYSKLHGRPWVASEFSARLAA